MLRLPGGEGRGEGERVIAPPLASPPLGPGAHQVLRIHAETGPDLHELHALIAPRPFLVSGGSEDPPPRWVALNHVVAVNRLLGQTNRVAMTNRKDHTPTPDSNNQLCAFFEHFLKYRGLRE